MKISIITPTLQRESLIRCCESVNEQSHENWEHIISIDGEQINDIVMEISTQNESRRKWVLPQRQFSNYGNTPRHIAWWWATGDVILYLDDDNFLLRTDSLEVIDSYTELEHGVNLFPILRFGSRFDPIPRLCHVDSANAIFRRDIAQWPVGPEYTMDGIFIERVSKDHGWLSHNTPPLVSVPVQSKGE